ncbi:MOSC domain-containing protein [Mucilaginibacter robiniae]|uniref:MOSC domain-containing protein n=1 Tax=Mucilaginibacter robiniae TaxID=2728022 RepID=A0A7L5DTH2_9SPHI|nr:MOSC domain-containing protein [Mucilaginibacter robiniae]QJD94390.1 MOSC domain-containing protein [Mucilaginibacter robiniae]
MKLSQSSPLQKLLDTLPQQGTVCWIGVRPKRKAAIQTLTQTEAITQQGITGDHYAGTLGSKRQVTLIQQEHLDAIASVMRIQPLSPELLRRNIVTKGINLLALKDKTFWVEDALLEYTGECHPCSRMEENLGPGGYNAVRGHGGITARILQGGPIKIGSTIRVADKLAGKQ